MLPTTRTVGLMGLLLAGVLCPSMIAVEAGDAPKTPLRSPDRTAVATVAERSAPVEKKSSPPSTVLAEIEAALGTRDAAAALEHLNARTTELSDEQRNALEGRARLILGEYAAARQKLEAAVRAAPKNAEYTYWLGRVYEAAGSPALAALQFEKSQFNGLDSAELHRHWAIVLRDSNRLLGEVQRRPKPADESDEPLGPGIFAFDGVVVGFVSAHPDWVIVAPANSAIYQIHRALAIEPDDGGSLLLCAEILAAAKRHAEAVAMFAKAVERIKSEQDLARCYEGWAASLLELGDFDGYLKHVQEKARITGKPDSVELAACYARAADAVARRGDLQRQIRYLRMSLELHPQVGRMIDLADALTAAQQADEAERILEQAFTRNPSESQQRQIRERLHRATMLQGIR